MPPSMLGALLGVANMAVIAFAIALDIGEGAEPFGALMFIGGVPAALAGLALGAVAGRTRSWSVGARYAVIGIPALVITLLCGCALIPFVCYIPFACVPTLCAVRVLERATRASSPLPPVIQWRRASEPQRGAMPIDPIMVGMMLAVANLIVIAIGMSGLERGISGLHHHGTETCFHTHMHQSAGRAVFIVGLLPAVVTGALLGHVAHRCRDWPLWSRRLVLVSMPIFVVVLLGAATLIYQYVLPASVPTAVAALWLERVTRGVTLPSARAI